MYTPPTVSLLHFSLKLAQNDPRQGFDLQTTVHSFSCIEISELAKFITRCAATADRKIFTGVSACTYTSLHILVRL
jgi:hypothetical protein